MTTLYNEIDPYAAQWLRNLIAAGHITGGRVDERPIQELRPGDLDGVVRAHFFAGIAGWDLALRLAGWPADRPVWTGSCPCQPFSVAGLRRGTDDERHLWPEWLRLITECRPPTIFGEQVASPDGRAWLASVRADLEVLGYAVGAADLCAAGVGAPHIRQRLYWVAVADRDRLEGIGLLLRGRRPREGLPETPRGCEAGEPRDPWSDAEWIYCRDGKHRPAQPGSFPLAAGVPARVVKLRAFGNAIVPPLAATFVRAVMEAL